MNMKSDLIFDRMLNSTNQMLRIFETGCFLENFFGVNAPAVRDFDVLESIVDKSMDKDNYLDMVLCVVHGMIEEKPLEYGNDVWSFTYGANCIDQIAKDFSKDCGASFGELIKDCSNTGMDEDVFIEKGRELIRGIAFIQR